MAQFRLAHSTLSAAEVGKHVAEQFSIGSVVSCSLLKRRFNDSYALTTNTGQRFVFRIGARQSHEPVDLDYEVEFLNHLAGRGVPVAAPISDRDGRFWHTVESVERNRLCVLFCAAEGRVPNPISRFDAQAQGATLALVHSASETFRPSAKRFQLDLDHLVYRPLSNVTELSIVDSDDRTYLTTLARQLAQRVHHLEPHLTRTHCHGDCHGWNARIIDEGQGRTTATFFDFDDSGPGWLAYDLAVFLWSSRTYMGEQRGYLWPHFLDGYSKFRRIKSVDFEAIPLFVAIRNIWLMGEYASRSDEWGSELFDREWLKRQVGFLRTWEDQQLSSWRLL